MPPPEAVLYPLNIISAPPSNSYASAPSLSSRSTIKTVLGSLSAWENRLGWVGRGWLEGPTPEESERGEAGELFKEGETWAIKWGYGNAVDGDWGTAFRSRDGTFSNPCFSPSFLSFFPEFFFIFSLTRLSLICVDSD